MKVFLALAALAALVAVLAGGSQAALQLRVKNMSGQITGVEVEGETAVADIKAKVAQKYNVTTNRLRLIFLGKLLEDGLTVTDYKMENNSILHSVVKPERRASMQVMVRNSGDKRIFVDLNEEDKIASLKGQISFIENVPVEHQQLLFEGKVLEDDKSLTDYGIGNLAILHLLYCRPDSIQLYISFPQRFALIVDANLNDSVLSLKQKIRDQTKIPVEHQKLTGDSKRRMLDAKTLAYYEVQKAPILQMKNIEHGDYFHAFVWIHEERCVTMYFKATDTVLRAKEHITEFSKLPASQMMLWVDDQLMEDHMLLQDYEVDSYSHIIVHDRLAQNNSGNLRTSRRS